MHALDWLNKCGRILCGAFQSLECVLFESLLLSLSLQCDSAFNVRGKGFKLVTIETVRLMKEFLQDQKVTNLRLWILTSESIELTHPAMFILL